MARVYEVLPKSKFIKINRAINQIKDIYPEFDFNLYDIININDYDFDVTDKLNHIINEFNKTIIEYNQSLKDNDDFSCFGEKELLSIDNLNLDNSAKGPKSINWQSVLNKIEFNNTVNKAC